MKMFVSWNVIRVMIVVLFMKKQVIENGYNFDIPEDCLLEREQYKKDNSPVAMFFDECCEMRKSDKISDACTTKKMYEVFKAWCVDNNKGYAPSNQDFKREMSKLLNIDIKDIIKRTKVNTFYIFTLTLHAKQDYVKIYGYDSTV